MSGYVSFHLPKKYGKGTSNSELRSKWLYFMHVLERMKARHQQTRRNGLELPSNLNRCGISKLQIFQ